MKSVTICLMVMGVIISLQSKAQSCCSGGVPITGNLGMPPGNAGTWQFSLNYDANILKTLKDEDNVLDDDSRERITHSVLLQGSYGFTPRLSAEFFLSWVRQERTIRQFNNKNFTATNGLGDAALLVKYQITNPSNTNHIAQIGAGTKIPTGKSDIATESGRTLTADLQPGSGAWDGIFWLMGGKKLALRPSMFATARMNYTIKGENPDYQNGLGYQFGKEFQAALEVSDKITIGSMLWDASLGIRYRNQGQDYLNGKEVPSTGGEWVFIDPSIGYNVSPDLSLNLSVTVPMYAYVVDTQVSPTIRSKVGIFYTIKKDKQIEVLDIKQ